MDAGGGDMSKRDPLVRDTKQRILDAALEVFGQHGYRGASVDDVAIRAGVTKGAVYYYFSDKNDLARDLQHTLWDRLAEQALAVYDPERSTVENLNACFDAFVCAVRAMTNARTFLQESWFSVWRGPTGRAADEDAVKLVEGLLAGGMARGELAAFDLDSLTRILVGALMEPTMAVVRHLVRSLAATPIETELAGTDAPTRQATIVRSRP
jgi:AcrR family transcriptional regulator